MVLFPIAVLEEFITFTSRQHLISWPTVTAHQLLLFNSYLFKEESQSGRNLQSNVLLTGRRLTKAKLSMVANDLVWDSEATFKGGWGSCKKLLFSVSVVDCCGFCSQSFPLYLPYV